jgi:hypothetical protein
MAGGPSNIIARLRDRLLGDVAARQLVGFAIIVGVGLVGFAAALFVGLKWGLIGAAVVLVAALLVLLWKG